MSKENRVPEFALGDYAKFFGAGALAATSTHAVSLHRVAGLGSR